MYWIGSGHGLPTLARCWHGTGTALQHAPGVPRIVDGC
jgi:hypothetical protein